MKLTHGTTTGFNADTLYDESGAVACVYGIPMNTRVEDVPSGGKWDEGMHKAAFIVKAVNSHERLVEALIRAIEWIDAVPDETVLPAMPGFDRDDVNELLSGLR